MIELEKNVLFMIFVVFLTVFNFLHNYLFFSTNLNAKFQKNLNLVIKQSSNFFFSIRLYDLLLFKDNLINIFQ
jgi:hypothetical protein